MENNQFKILGTPQNRKSKIDSGLAEKLNEYYSKPENQKKTNKRQQIPAQTQSPISSSQDYWTISGVNYRNKVYEINLLKSLLDNSYSKTQEQWAEYTEQAKQKGEFYTGDMPLYHAVFASLFNQREDTKSKEDIEEARAFIQKSMRENYPMTLTRIAYQPIGDDKVIHNFGTNDKYELSEAIVGPDRAIVKEDEKALIALLGTGDIGQIKSVYNWINGTDNWIWRVNSKPENVDERVARFIAGSVRALLLCYGGPDDRLASLGVRIVREAPRRP
ncbi:MAG: hypothetical protein PHH54_01560 [Candidatus Nanoarchaeia archaeon]|nr:hypothetical protein [Candidatus Nanoarchaeia archaeon]MDD5740651.1 hypothetical protein [Candidatus Nanoarchaeia archaeon]